MEPTDPASKNSGGDLSGGSGAPDRATGAAAERPTAQPPGRSSALSPAPLLDPAADPELASIITIAREAGALALRYFLSVHGRREPDADAAGAPRLAVEMKPGDEPVTEADRAVNALCVAGLRREFPQDAVLSEELPDDGARHHAPRTWLVDPIDGTKDFIAGRPGFAVMIGLLENRDGDARPTLGVVYQPTVDRLWYARRGRGAFEVVADRAPRRLAVSTVDVLTEARLVSSASHREELVAQVREAAGIRDEEQVGSVGVKLGLIAAGVRDLYVNPAGRCKLWDTGAPEIILAEAGGRLTDFAGQPLRYTEGLGHNHGLVASNGGLHDAALERLRPFLGQR
ncbi:MAG: 3'(2'),5'-bisphosphate nucleotidase CysQ [Polyangia bacterium]